MTQWCRTRAAAVFFCVIILLGLLLALSGCSSKPKKESRRYEITGKVISVDKTKKQVMLAHEDIPGLMKGMTMGFRLKDDWPLNTLAPGDHLNGVLVMDPDGEYIESVVITRRSGTEPEPSTSNAHLPEVGDEVPDFAFLNQDGRHVSMKQFRGRPLLLTFIYTRCPLPDYCIRMSSNFADIARQLKQQDAALYAKLQMLSISIDPEFDKPAVLKQYAKNYAGEIDPKSQHWQFVGGPPEDIRKTADYFGLSYLKEKDQIVHSLRTVLLDGNGKIVALYHGNEWKTADVVRDLQKFF